MIRTIRRIRTTCQIPILIEEAPKSAHECALRRDIGRKPIQPQRRGGRNRTTLFERFPDSLCWIFGGEYKGLSDIQRDCHMRFLRGKELAGHPGVQVAVTLPVW